MKKKSRHCNSIIINIALASVLIPNLVNAATTIKLDYRHEYKNESKQSADRLKTFITTDSVLWEIEARTSSGESQWFEDQTISSYDIGLFYPYQYNKNLTVLSGFDYIMETANQQYIPSLRINYKTDSGIRLQTRYKQIISEKVAEGASDQSHVQRIDFWLGYTLPSWDFQYQVSFGKELNNDQPLQDNKDTDYWQNIRIRYQQFKTLRPYIEIGDVKVSRNNDERQLRYRVGFLYAF